MENVSALSIRSAVLSAVFGRTSPEAFEAAERARAALMAHRVKALLAC